MIEYNVKYISERYDFTVNGVSYIGNPKMNTAMYVSKKVAHLIKNLDGLQKCLVFTEEGIEVADKLKKQNCFIFCRNPQLEYARFVNVFAEEKRNMDSKRKYVLVDAGYYLGENVQIGFIHM